MITEREWKAGRQLDAEIARRVFGFWRDGGHWWGPHPSTEGAKAYASVCVPIPSQIWGPNCDQSDGLPRFSTDIAAALQVIEQLRRDGWDFLANAMPDVSDADTWCCWFSQSRDDGQKTYGETLPLAACRAALAVVPSEQHTHGGGDA